MQRLHGGATCSQLAARITKMQAMCISGKAYYEPDPNKPKPYPYKEKKYTHWHSIFDFTTPRLDENSKLILIEGNICSGKSVLAENLAKDLGFHFIPEATMDSYYINSYGYNLRELDNHEDMPESMKSFCLPEFYKNPTSLDTGVFQTRMYGLRYHQAADALIHILSTGQGVVLDRSVWSDFVFMEAMHRAKYLTPRFKKYYNDVVECTMYELMKPHLVIYLDVPVSMCLDRIKKRNIDYEVNSSVLTNKYLEDIEDIYKNQFLEKMAKNSELLIYDWSEFGESELVVEDIERMDFDSEEKVKEKFKDWNIVRESEWANKRKTYSHHLRHRLDRQFNVPTYDVPELWRNPEDVKAWIYLWEHAPGQRYVPGYNTDMGDRVLFKS